MLMKILMLRLSDYNNYYNYEKYDNDNNDLWLFRTQNKLDARHHTTPHHTTTIQLEKK